eukprot:1158895-Pelagomonas_calceolata.AAC.4
MEIRWSKIRVHAVASQACAPKLEDPASDKVPVCAHICREYLKGTCFRPQAAFSARILGVVFKEFGTINS